MLHILLLTVTPILKDRELVLVGDHEPDRVTVLEDGVYFNEDAGGYDFVPFGDFDSLTILLRGGDDHVDVVESPGGPIYVDLGTEDDQFSGGHPTISGTVRAGPGNDRIIFEDSRIDGLYVDAGPGDDYLSLNRSRVENLTARLGAGNDDAVAHEATILGSVSMHGGGGIDVYEQVDSDGTPDLRGFESYSSQSALVTNQLP